MTRLSHGVTSAAGRDAPARGTLTRDPPLAHAGRYLAVGAGLLVGLATAPAALAQGGDVPTEPPDPVNLLTGWSGDPMIWLPAIAALLLWWIAVRRVNRAHPANPVPRARSWSWATGVVIILIALDSGIGTYDDILFSIHMLQHILLALVAPPFLLYAGPITLLLRAASSEARHRWILPVLRSRVVRFLSFPVVAWLLFAAVMWGVHFSPLFDAALENAWVHRFEHALFLFAALLFWWPVIGSDPSPWRMSPGVKLLYVGLQMPQNSFLGLAIYMSGEPLYQHYATLVRAWGPTALEDQRLAGGLMWIGGSLISLTIVLLLVIAWMRDEDRRAPAEDHRLDVEEAMLGGRVVPRAGHGPAGGPPGGLPSG